MLDNLIKTITACLDCIEHSMISSYCQYQVLWYHILGTDTWYQWMLKAKLSVLFWNRKDWISASLLSPVDSVFNSYCFLSAETQLVKQCIIYTVKCINIWGETTFFLNYLNFYITTTQMQLTELKLKAQTFSFNSVGWTKKLHQNLRKWRIF